MFITSRESAIFPCPVSLPFPPQPAPRLHPNRASPARSRRPLYVCHMPVRGVSVSRAYISPEKPCLQANFRVLLGFLPFFWTEEKCWLAAMSICCRFAQQKHN